MKNSVIHLIRFAKSKDYVVSVYDGGAWPVKRSTNEKEILEAINSVDEAQLRIIDMEAPETLNRVAWVLIVNGLDPDELVADYSDNAFMQEWNAQYTKDNE